MTPYLKLVPLAVLGLGLALAAWLGRSAKKKTWATSPSTARTLAIAVIFGLPLAYVGLVAVDLLREGVIRFGEPRATYVIFAVGLVAAYRFNLLQASLAAFRKRSIVVLTSLALLFASLVLAEPELGKPLDRMTAIIALDRSRSMELVPGGDDRIRAELELIEQGMRGDDRIGRTVFGAEAATEDPPRVKTSLPSSQRVPIGRDGTDLDMAIRHALSELPPDTSGRIILVSDGVQTRGDALSASAAAIAANVPIDVLVMEQRSVKDVRIVSVRAPTRIGQGEPLDLRVVTASGSDTEVEIRVKRDGEIIHRGKAKIAKGEDLLRIREVADVPGLHRYDVEVSALDTSADESVEDNVGSTFVRVKGASLALIVEGDEGKGAPIRRALELLGMRVVERSTSSVPADVGEFAPFDLVVWSDIRASDISPTQIDALSSYVKDLGGGVMFLGGDRSFGPGGYAGTSVEEISPVSFDLKEQKRRASLAEVILIDYSGSMSATVGGQTKLALANEAAARSASLLGPGDLLGVSHIDTTVAWTIPLGPVKDPGAIGATIRHVGVGGGGIYTDIALKAGYEALLKETVNLKHVLLFADGSDAERLTGCRAQVAGAFSRGITTSVISLGKGSDTPELEMLSKAGNGRFYLIEDATRLPSVFTQETILASKGAISEKPFRVALGAPTPATRGLDFKDAPALDGYVSTVGKPRATVALTGPEGDPVFATWVAGLGRATAFTSDYKDRWGHAWLSWPGGAKLFGQAAQDTARGGDDPKVRIESDASGGELHIRADVVGEDGRSQSFRRLVVQVAGPDGFSREVALEAVGPGRYAAALPLTRPGTYVATARDEATGQRLSSTASVLSLGEELRPTGTDRALLTRVAAMTGGKVRDTLAGLYDDRPPRRFAYRSLSLPIALAAAILLLVAVAARRLGIPNVAALLGSRVSKWREGRSAADAARASELAEAHARAEDANRRNRELILASKKRHERGSGPVVLPETHLPHARTPAPPRADPTPLPPGAMTGARADRLPGDRGPGDKAHGDKAHGDKAPGGEGARQPTTAERLAQKRRERK